MTDPADLTGQTLGDFRVVRKLGSGGMGTVYLARQLSLKRDVALKLLRSEQAKNETALKRFRAEAEAVARISHPNIVQVYAFGEHDGLNYMALEYVEGRNLREFLTKKGPPDLPVALAILRQTASALQRAAEAGIVHRDIKPENILLTRKAEVKVADFGLSRLSGDGPQLNLTQSGVALGTPLYMSPEQVQGKATDHRSDLYSLGVTAYHLLAGRPPFGGLTAYEVAMKHCTEQPPPLAGERPDLPVDLCNLVHKLMAKDPIDRYATAKDVIRDLAKLREGLTLNLPAPPAVPPVSATGGPGSQSSTMAFVPQAPNPWPGRVLGALAVAALGAGGWFAYGATHPSAPAPPSVPGLPTARPPERVVSPKEHALNEVINRRGAKAADVQDALLDLGLLCVAEHRFDDADAAFTKLAAERPDVRDRPGLRLGGPRHVTASDLGKAVVLAHREKAKEAVAGFEAVLNRFPKSAGGAFQVRLFLLEHPDLAAAVSEAVHRCEENLKPTKLPSPLDALKAPGR